MTDTGKTPLPIDLIVATLMHAGLDKLKQVEAMQDAIKSITQRIEKDIGPVISETPDLMSQFYPEMARALLCEVANKASLVEVFRALAAVGAPTSIDMLREGIQAVKDRQPTV